MAVLLLEEQKKFAINASDGDDQEEALLTYLKTLSPAAFDAELRSLCLYDSDEEGLTYLAVLLQWMAVKLAKKTDFELLLAYLHRILIIYDSVIVKRKAMFEASLDLLSEVQCVNSAHFRRIIHSNLCLLKMVAKVN